MFNPIWTKNCHTQQMTSLIRRLRMPEVAPHHVSTKKSWSIPACSHRPIIRTTWLITWWCLGWQRAPPPLHTIDDAPNRAGVQSYKLTIISVSDPTPSGLHILGMYNPSGYFTPVLASTNTTLYSGNVAARSHGWPWQNITIHTASLFHSPIARFWLLSFSASSTASPDWWKLIARFWFLSLDASSTNIIIYYLI